MKRAMCFWLMLALAWTAGSALANDFVEKKVYFLLEELEEGVFLGWREDGEHRLIITEDTRVETATPPAPGMFVLVQDKSGADGLTAVSVRDYVLDGLVCEAEEGRIYLYDESYFYGIWIRLPEGTDAAALKGKILSIPVKPVSVEDVYSSLMLEARDYSDFVEAVSMTELTRVEGTVLEYGEDSLMFRTREGDFRVTVTPDTKCRYKCQVGRYVYIHYLIDESGEVVLVSMIPLNG